MESLLEALDGYSYKVFYSHGVQIPDCFEKPTKRALKGKYTHIWYVEEDNVYNQDTLKDLLKLDADIACADYNLQGGNPLIGYNEDGSVANCGTGCMLVKRRVFKNPPYFRSDIVYLRFDNSNEVETESQQDNASVYGRHDIFFCRQATKNGFKIKMIDKKIGHLKVKNIGKDFSNTGFHEIYEL